MNNPSIFSFFSGSGFLDLGFENEDFNIVFVNEYYKPFIKAYEYTREIMKISEPEFGYSNESIAEYISGSKALFLKDAVKKKQKDGLVGFLGGPPCPDFSVGGKNKGRYGDNGQLSEIYVNIINNCKPDFFLFENVKGLWQTKKHREYFEELKRKLQENNYITTEKLINSIEYGSPQNRERIILLGFQENLINSLNIKEYNNRIISNDIFPWKLFTNFDKNEIFSLSWPKQEIFKENSEKPAPNNIPKELTIQYWFSLNDVDNHYNSAHCFQPRAGLTRFKTVDEGDDSKKSFKRLHRWRYSPTACYGNNEVHLHPYKTRRISVSEALAIQSLPKNFILPDDITLTDMFKTVGNGVPYLAAKGLAKSINCFLGIKR